MGVSSGRPPPGGTPFPVWSPIVVGGPHANLNAPRRAFELTAALSSQRRELSEHVRRTLILRIERAGLAREV
ncbi:MAG TPA: hypothetical protein VLK58_12970, partial [Conexibacter sp.]|nr:hypothetical protein [Conexibacter sp.]